MTLILSGRRMQASWCGYLPSFVGGQAHYTEQPVSDNAAQVYRRRFPRTACRDHRRTPYLLKAECSLHYSTPAGLFSFVLCKHRTLTPGILNFISSPLLLPATGNRLLPSSAGSNAPTHPVHLLVMVNLPLQKPRINFNYFF